MVDALVASAAVDEPSGAVGPREVDRSSDVGDRELLDSYSRAVVAVVEHVGPAVVSIAAGTRRAAGVVGAGSTTAHWLSKHRSAILRAGTELTLELNRPLMKTSAPAPSAGQ